MVSDGKYQGVIGLEGCLVLCFFDVLLVLLLFS